MKTCKQCLAFKTVEEFTRYRAICKICAAARKKLSHDRNYEVVKKYRLEHWALNLLRNATGRSRVRKHPAPTITETWILDQFQKQSGKCYWTGVSMVPSLETSLSIPSLDRLDCSGFYTPSNVVLASWGANRVRSNYSTKVLQKWIEEIRAA